MSDSLKDQYYKVIADLWGRFPWEDDIRADILETGGAPPQKNAGQIFLVRDDDTFDAEFAQEAVDAASEIDWEIYAGSTLGAADKILGPGECPQDQPGVSVAFESPAGGYSTEYQRVFNPSVDTEIL